MISITETDLKTLKNIRKVAKYKFELKLDTDFPFEVKYKGQTYLRHNTCGIRLSNKLPARHYVSLTGEDEIWLDIAGNFYKG